MLRYVLHAAPRAIPTTGRGTSGVSENFLSFNLDIKLCFSGLELRALRWVVKLNFKKNIASNYMCNYYTNVSVKTHTIINSVVLR